MTHEALSFHALNGRLQADYAKLSRLRGKHASWSEALRRENGPEPDLGSSEEELSGSGIRLILREEKEFPPLLHEIPHPPWGLYFKGELPTTAALAVVGTRKGTPGGLDLAEYFAKRLAGAGLVVVSGLALGIDAAAHLGALAAQGRTLAVLACGLDQVYPRTNARLADRILVEGGALISEYAPGVPPLPHRFLERNRIISGLALGTLVVEAPERSGSLATARFALEQNRQVFVVPGSARHPHYRGSHALIREGAELVCEAEQILESLGLAPEKTAEIPSAGGESGKKILGLLRAKRGGLDIDKIIELTNLEAPIVSQALSCLILEEKIKEEGGCYYPQ